MKFIPNFAIPAILHSSYLLLLVASSTLMVLKWTKTDAIIAENKIKPIQHFLSILAHDENSTCLTNIKRVQYDLESKTQVKCGLEFIRTETECQKWTLQNAQTYSQNASFRRLEECQNYLDKFPSTAHKPVKY